MNTTAKGNELESAIFQMLSQKIEADRFFARRECCEIHRQKGYFSKDRGSNIIFDVSIEIRNPGEHEFAILYLIECKNYARPVPVGDLESFFAKVNQVGAARTKAVVASASGFQEGAVRFARSHGMGLLRHFGHGDTKWILQRSPSAWTSPSAISNYDSAEITRALSDLGYRSRCFDWYCAAPSKATNSIDLFFASLAAHDADEDTSYILANVASPTTARSPTVPYLEKDAIEEMAACAHKRIEYNGYAVDLNAICDWQTAEKGLELEVVRMEKRSANHALGRYSADPLRITIFEAQTPRRERFTLAHELGHVLLGHSEHLLFEYTESDDIEPTDTIEFGTKDVRRLEWQANYFASCLLMPRSEFSRAFVIEANRLGLRDRGFGPLYVDEQRTNLRSFYTLTNYQKNRFDVSREAVRIRLIELGLLNDARRTPTPVQMLIKFGA